MKEKWSF